jgi:hypothetical protein
MPHHTSRSGTFALNYDHNMYDVCYSEIRTGEGTWTTTIPGPEIRRRPATSGPLSVPVPPVRFAGEDR